MKDDAERNNYTPPPSSSDGGNSDNPPLPNNNPDSPEMYGKLAIILTVFVRSLFRKNSRYSNECVSDVVGEAIYKIIAQNERSIIRELEHYSYKVARNEFYRHVKTKCMLCQNKAISLTQDESDAEEDRNKLSEMIRLSLTVPPNQSQIEVNMHVAKFLKKLLSLLTPAELEFFDAFFRKEKSYEEISKETGKTEAALRKTKHRIMKKIDDLRDDGWEPHFSAAAA